MRMAMKLLVGEGASALYDASARKRPVNLSLNEDLVREVRGLVPNLSEHVERLLSEHLAAEAERRREADARLTRTLDALDGFHEQMSAFADEHSTL